MPYSPTGAFSIDFSPLDFDVWDGTVPPVPPHVIVATNGAGTVTPSVIEGYKPRRESRNKIHDLLDGSIGVAFIAPRPRAGTLRMMFRTEADAFAAYNLHAVETTFTLTSTAVVSASMAYVLDGSLDIELDRERAVWWVEVGYQEVTP
jgi:hypothetical protein